MAARPRPGDLPRGRVCRTPESVDDAASTDGGITGSPATNTSLGSTCSPSWENQAALDESEQAKLRGRKGNQSNQPEIFTRLYDEAERLKQARATKLEQHLAAVKLQSAKTQARQGNWEQVAQRLHDEHRERIKKQKARMDEKIRKEEAEIEEQLARTEYRVGQAQKIADRLHDQEIQKRRNKEAAEKRKEEAEKLQASKKVSSNPQTLERLYNEHASKKKAMEKKRQEYENREKDMLTQTSVHRCRSADGTIFDRLYAEGAKKRADMEKLRAAESLVSPMRRSFSPVGEPRISSSLLSPTAASKGKLTSRPTAEDKLPAFNTYLQGSSFSDFTPAPRKPKAKTKDRQNNKSQEDASGLDELGIQEYEEGGDDAGEDADEGVYDEGAEEEVWEEGAEEEVAEEGDEAAVGVIDEEECF